MKLLNDCDSRYPTREEEETILAYAASVPQRLQTAALIEKHEEELVGASIEGMRRRYARFHSLHDRGWEKSHRDMQLCLRYAVQGMLVEDVEMPRDKLFAWLCTIVKGMGMTPQFSRDCYEMLYDNARKKLPEENFALVEPYLKRLTADMSDFPEPSRPAVN